MTPFEVMIDWGRIPNFPVKTSEGGPEDYQKYVESIHPWDQTYKNNDSLTNS